MVKTISKRVFLRLGTQADEADIYGHYVIAEALTTQLSKYSDHVRDEVAESEYTFSKEELIEEIKEKLWDCAARIFDYYKETPDARDVDDIIEFEADSLIGSIENLVKGDIGPYEPEVAGEEFVEEPVSDYIEDENYIEE